MPESTPITSPEDLEMRISDKVNELVKQALPFINPYIVNSRENKEIACQIVRSVIGRDYLRYLVLKENEDNISMPPRTKYDPVELSKRILHDTFPLYRR